MADTDTQNLNVLPGLKRRTVRTKDGETWDVPEDWAFLKPGDAALTRKVKKAGPSWTVQVKKGRKTMSRGVWAPAANIEQAEGEVSAMRRAPGYHRKLNKSRERRAVKEVEYTQDFAGAVAKFLGFAERYEDLQGEMAAAIAAHATPVGSGTVARTKRIPIEERAEAAVIAWMRHQTSAYDQMSVPKVKGARRDLRRRIANRSRALLTKYRSGRDIDEDECPLFLALAKARDVS